MAEKEWLIKVSDKDYFDLPDKLKLNATAYFNEYQDYKDDELFIKLHRAHKKAKKELEQYKFNRRHG